LAVQLLDERLALFRLADGNVRAVRDLCPHRGAPLSSGAIREDKLVCAYHGLEFDGCGRCVGIPAQRGSVISSRLHLQTYPVREGYGLVWVRLVEDGPREIPAFEEWNDPDYLQILPEAFVWKASAGRQLESFIDVSHFAFVHLGTFGEAETPDVAEYKVIRTDVGFEFDYVSLVSNYAVGWKHLNPPGFLWSRFFRVFLPFCAKLSISFPDGGKLHILNAASPISARRTRVFVPICRNFDKEAPLQPTLDFNHKVFDEDRAIVEQQYPQDLPIDLAEDVHIRADRASITYRQMLGELGLSRTFTA
jgi:vanillate O-demethylase monooxygenase subunit